MVVLRLANNCSILRVICSEKTWRERLLVRYVRVVVSRLRMIGEEMRGRPLGWQRQAVRVGVVLTT